MVLYELSLRQNVIHQNINSGSDKVQTLLAACWKFTMVRISDKGPGWKKGLMPFFAQAFCKNNLSSYEKTSQMKGTD